MRVWVTPHAAERYVERVKPCMEVRRASWELGRLCMAARQVEKPEWAGDDGSDVWLELSDGIVVAVTLPTRVGRLPAALTVLIRGGMDESRRQRRNAARARRRAARRTRNRLRTGRPGSGRDFALSDTDA